MNRYFVKTNAFDKNQEHIVTPVLAESLELTDYDNLVFYNNNFYTKQREIVHIFRSDVWLTVAYEGTHEASSI